MTISGEAGQCARCVNRILAKLDEQEEVISYANRGTTYSAPNSRGFGAFGGRGMGRGVGGGRGRGGRGEKAGPASESEPETITMAVPNELVGNIFGKQVS